MTGVTYGSENQEEVAFVRRLEAPQRIRHHPHAGKSKKMVFGAVLATTCCGIGGYVALQSSSTRSSATSSTSSLLNPSTISALASLTQSTLTTEQMQDEFYQCDENRDGEVSQEEMAAALRVHWDNVIDQIHDLNLDPTVMNSVLSVARSTQDCEKSHVSDFFAQNQDQSLQLYSYMKMRELVNEECGEPLAGLTNGTNDQNTIDNGEEASTTETGASSGQEETNDEGETNTTGTETSGEGETTTEPDTTTQGEDETNDTNGQDTTADEGESASTPEGEGDTNAPEDETNSQSITPEEGEETNAPDQGTNDQDVTSQEGEETNAPDQGTNDQDVTSQEGEETNAPDQGTNDQDVTPEEGETTGDETPTTAAPGEDETSSTMEGDAEANETNAPENTPNDEEPPSESETTAPEDTTTTTEGEDETSGTNDQDVTSEEEPTAEPPAEGEDENNNTEGQEITTTSDNEPITEEPYTGENNDQVYRGSNKSPPLLTSDNGGASLRGTQQDITTTTDNTANKDYFSVTGVEYEIPAISSPNADSLLAYYHNEIHNREIKLNDARIEVSRQSFVLKMINFCVDQAAQTFPTATNEDQLRALDWIERQCMHMPDYLPHFQKPQP